MATIIKTGEIQSVGRPTICLHCQTAVPVMAPPIAFEVTDGTTTGFVHSRCKAAWDKAHASPTK